ncbi:DNA methylase [Sulfolobus acidocaldarius SUSAZ]|nr:DNA methylase [Sulfolobus acidocaldarius SUSAZ]
MTLKTFYIQQWIDNETFKKLLTFCRFLGRDSNNGSIFVIDVDRAIKNGIRLIDIKNILEEIGVEFSEEDFESLKKYLPSYDVEFELNSEGLIIKPHVYLMELIKDYYEQKIIKYDKTRKIFITFPYYYVFLKSRFEENGLIVKPLDLQFDVLDLEFKGELREYQKEALSKWLEKGSGVIALPTGAGKTLIGISAACAVKQSTLIVTYTKEQMLQWRDAFIRFTNIEKRKIGLYYSEKKEIRPITISTYQTAYRHIQELSYKFDVLVIDEAHHLPAEKFKRIALNSIATKRLGLSATPYRDDGKHEELFKFMGGLIYFKSPQELIEKGYLAPYEVVQEKVQLSIDERMMYNELLNKFKKYSKSRKVSELLMLAKKGDSDAIEALKIYNEMRKLVNLAKQKIDAVKKIVENEKGNKILIFTQYVDQAEEIARAINGLLITGKISKSERERILNIFKSMKSGVLVLTTVGDEGLDIPDANVGIIVTGTGSRRQFIQRLGRLLRPGVNKKARLYEIMVRGTAEEYQALKRKETQMDMFLSSADDDI